MRTIVLLDNISGLRLTVTYDRECLSCFLAVRPTVPVPAVRGVSWPLENQDRLRRRKYYTDVQRDMDTMAGLCEGGLLVHRRIHGLY